MNGYIQGSRSTGGSGEPNEPLITKIKVHPDGDFAYFGYVTRYEGKDQRGIGFFVEKGKCAFVADFSKTGVFFAKFRKPLDPAVNLIKGFVFYENAHLLRSQISPIVLYRQGLNLNIEQEKEINRHLERNADDMFDF